MYHSAHLSVSHWADLYFQVGKLYQGCRASFSSEVVLVGFGLGGVTASPRLAIHRPLSRLERSAPVSRLA
jgi:esterase/lipase